MKQAAVPLVYRARDGVQIAPPHERFELLMRHHEGRDMTAHSASFEALLELSGQLVRLGYALVRLERLTTP